MWCNSDAVNIFKKVKKVSTSVVVISIATRRENQGIQLFNLTQREKCNTIN